MFQKFTVIGKGREVMKLITNSYQILDSIVSKKKKRNKMQELGVIQTKIRLILVFIIQISISLISAEKKLLKY